MFIKGKIKPKWNIEDFKNLQYKLNPDDDLSEEYSSYGHNRNCMYIYNCFQDNINLDTSYIFNSFNFLNCISIAVNLFKPGNYIPLHSDKFEKYKKIHKLNDISKIIRIILMLEDNDPGQIIQINEEVIGRWNSGEWFGWTGNDTHAFYNFSKKDRYAIQISGLLI